MSYNFEKHPDEDLDYGFDLVDWLTGGEVISSVSFVADPSGLLVLHNPVNTGMAFATFVSGGAVGDRVKITCTATTDSTPPRTFVRTDHIAIVRR